MGFLTEFGRWGFSMWGAKRLIAFVLVCAAAIVSTREIFNHFVACAAQEWVRNWSITAAVQNSDSYLKKALQQTSITTDTCSCCAHIFQKSALQETGEYSLPGLLKEWKKKKAFLRTF